ncbi:unnamed protein product, partial [marine sediment metagenome]
GIRAEVEAKTAAPGSTTVNCKTLRDTLRGLKASEVALSHDEKTLSISAGATKITLPTLPADEYPALPDSTTTEGLAELNIPADHLREAIRRTLPAASTDETLAILTGLLLEQRERTLRLVATDTYHLHVVTLERSGDCGDDWSAIIPARALKLVGQLLPKKYKDDVTLTFGEQQVAMCWPGRRIVTRLIQGQYWNYQRVIPGNAESRTPAQVGSFTVDRDAQIDALKVAAPIALSEAGKIILTPRSDAVEVTAKGYPDSQISQDVPAIGQGGIKQAYNVDYLLDALNACGEGEVTFKQHGEISPFL